MTAPRIPRDWSRTLPATDWGTPHDIDADFPAPDGTWESLPGWLRTLLVAVGLVVGVAMSVIWPWGFA